MKKLIMLLTLSFALTASADEGRGPDLRNQLDSCTGNESATLVCVSKVFLEKLNQLEKSLGRIERGIRNVNPDSENSDPARKEHLFEIKDYNGRKTLFSAVITGSLRRDRDDCDRIQNSDEFKNGITGICYIDGNEWGSWLYNLDRKSGNGACMQAAASLNK